MKGFGIIKGLGVTLKHIFDTYAEDIKAGRKRYYTEEGVRQRMTPDTKGIFTVNYPEERVPTAENLSMMRRMENRLPAAQPAGSAVRSAPRSVSGSPVLRIRGPENLRRRRQSSILILTCV
jgi:hypothetical protein